MSTTDESDVPSAPLLLDLPGPALQLLVHHLAASGSTGLRGLQGACRATCDAVLQHAQRMQYSPRHALHGHAWLHAAAQRPKADLCLELDVAGVSSSEMSRVFMHPLATQRSSAAAMAGVQELHLMGAGGQSTVGWGHLVGPDCPNLTSFHISGLVIQHDMLQCLQHCRITHLTLGPNTHMGPHLAPLLSISGHASPLPSLQHLTVHSSTLYQLVKHAAPRLRSLHVRDCAVTGPLEVAIEMCEQLEELVLPKGHEAFDDTMELLTALPALQHLRLGACFLQLPQPAASQWKTLQVDAMDVETAQYLPQLPGLEMLQLGGLIVPVSSTAAETTALLAPGMAVLGRLAASGRLQWGTSRANHGAATAHITLGIHVDEDQAEDDLPVMSAASVQAALRALAPLAPCTTNMVLVMSDADVMERQGAGMLTALAHGFSHLQHLELDGGPVLSPTFWSVLQPRLPCLHTLTLTSTDEVDTGALSVFAATAQRPMLVEFCCVRDEVWWPVQDMMDEMREEGVTSVVTVTRCSK